MADADADVGRASSPRAGLKPAQDLADFKSAAGCKPAPRGSE